VSGDSTGVVAGEAWLHKRGLQNIGNYSPKNTMSIPETTEYSATPL
jgi:hypothetical protein